MQNKEITQQEIINVKEYNNRERRAEVQKLLDSCKAWDIAKANIKKAKRCFVWTRAFTDGDGVYVRVYKKDLLQKLDFRNCDSVICNDYKIRLDEEYGNLFID
jgi:hypothetical protein